jgi:pheromone shutdown protein TraB
LRCADTDGVLWPHNLRAILVADDAAQKRQAVDNYSRRAPALLDERDEYAAKRIDSTLGEGESGVLFIGLAHQIVKRLPTDIAVTTLP